MVDDNNGSDNDDEQELPKMKQSIVQEAFRHPYLHAMTCDTCYGVRFQRLSAVREKEGNNRGSMTDMPQFLTQIRIQYSFSIYGSAVGVCV